MERGHRRVSEDNQRQSWGSPPLPSPEILTPFGTAQGGFWGRTERTRVKPAAPPPRDEGARSVPCLCLLAPAFDPHR